MFHTNAFSICESSCALTKQFYLAGTAFKLIRMLTRQIRLRTKAGVSVVSIFLSTDIVQDPSSLGVIFDSYAITGFGTSVTLRFL